MARVVCSLLVALAISGCGKPAPTASVDPPVVSVATAPPTAPSAAPSAPAVVPVDAAALASAPLRAMIKPKNAEDTPLPAKSLGKLRTGMRVRIIKRDRALRPEETGHTASVALGPGQQGTVERFIKRKLSGYTFDVAVVRWDAQTWHEWDIPLHQMKQGVAYSGEDLNRMNKGEGTAVTLGPIETAAHPETLEEVK